MIFLHFLRLLVLLYKVRIRRYHDLRMSHNDERSAVCCMQLKCKILGCTVSALRMHTYHLTAGECLARSLL